MCTLGGHPEQRISVEENDNCWKGILELTHAFALLELYSDMCSGVLYVNDQVYLTKEKKLHGLYIQMIEGIQWGWGCMEDSHPFPKKIKHYDGMVLKFKVSCYSCTSDSHMYILAGFAVYKSCWKLVCSIILHAVTFSQFI